MKSGHLTPKLCTDVDWHVFLTHSVVLTYLNWHASNVTLSAISATGVGIFWKFKTSGNIQKYGLQPGNDQLPFELAFFLSDNTGLMKKNLYSLHLL